MYGYYKVASAMIQAHVANCNANAQEIVSLIKEADSQECSAIVFPELCITSYSASDLFLSETLMKAQNMALDEILKQTKHINILAIVGVAILDANRLYNCAVIIQSGRILGAVPKSYLPNKKEFYEKRHFNSGRDIVRASLCLLGQDIPFGVDLLFSDDKHMVFGVEICEDLWAITPPSNHMASNGANLIFNLSASNELIGKHKYRQELVRTQSARCMAAYVYSSAGVGESTADTVYGGECIIGEYGSIVAQNMRFQSSSHIITAEVDLQRLKWLRINESSYCDSRRKRARTIKLGNIKLLTKLEKKIDSTPFVPNRDDSKQERAQEIIQIQAYGLIKRLEHTKIPKVLIGVSGGLDSTLALLSVHKAYELIGRDSSDIIAVTMPGFGTTDRTKMNALALCEALGVTLKMVDITDISLKEFDLIGHDIDDLSVTYENVQARARTSVLMNMSNQENGLVIGTGDLSEIALGWSTYNGDHMSMYAINCGIPKTLIKYVIESFKSDSSIAPIISDILATPISPELLPSKSGEIAQETESIVGPYELHDFFLYHFIKYGARPSKIRFLALNAFDGKYGEAIITKWLKVFIKRFFTQQFKRNSMPDGPKVGTISLSQRADWRMASDADMDIWMNELDE